MIWEELNEGDRGVLAEVMQDGHLLDLYSEKWLALNAERVGLSYSAPRRARLGSECFHHLHVLCIDSSGVADRLVQVAPELAWQFGQISPDSGLSLHEPDFVFFNTREQLIVSVGLGRKNRLFAFSARQEEVLQIDFENDQSKCDDPVIRRFTQLDDGQLFWTLCHALEQLGASYYYGQPKLTVSSRATIRAFFPFLDTRHLNTRDY